MGSRVAPVHRRPIREPISHTNKETIILDASGSTQGSRLFFLLLIGQRKFGEREREEQGRKFGPIGGKSNIEKKTPLVTGNENQL
jgi:hypothetical protein